MADLAKSQQSRGKTEGKCRVGSPDPRVGRAGNAHRIGQQPGLWGTHDGDAGLQRRANPVRSLMEIEVTQARRRIVAG